MAPVCSAIQLRQRAAAATPRDAARRRCRAGSPCARRRAGSRRSPCAASRRRRRSAGARDALGCAATAAAMSASACGQRARRARSTVRAIGISQSSSHAHAASTPCAPLLAPPGAGAARTADGPCAGSEPTTSTRSSVDSVGDRHAEPAARRARAVAAEVASGAGGSRCCRCRGRASACAARCSSSSVRCGETSAPIARAPCSRDDLASGRCATYSSAVGQSTAFHSPPCLIIGARQALVASSAPS